MLILFLGFGTVWKWEALPTSCQGTYPLRFQGRKVQGRVTQKPKNGRRVGEVDSTVWLDRTCVRGA